MFPLDALNNGQRELGLVFAVAVGFGFGFVLERAGFGRAQKLVAQFYGNDMTVFKVMFSAIVTAMLGTVVLGEFGVIDLRGVADFASSGTYLWPMLIGGLMLGVGFIVSGYCPGTSWVAAASGKVDGLVTAVSVIAGTLLYAEVQPLLGKFHTSGDLGHFYLYDWLKVPPAVVAAGVTAMAVACFIGAEAIERRLNKGRAPEEPRRPGRFAWAGLGTVAALALAFAFLPLGTPAHANVKPCGALNAEQLAVRVLSEPWSVRVVDLRSAEDCAKARVPGSECVPVKSLPSLGLSDAPASRDLILVSDQPLVDLPRGADGYKGDIYVLSGGFAAWRDYALTPPAPLPANATAQQRDAFQLRSGLYAAMTGVPQAPPPPPPSGGAVPAKKKAGGGGCGG